MKKWDFTYLASGTKYEDVGIHLPLTFIQRHFVPSGDHLELHFVRLAATFLISGLYQDF